MQTNNIAQSTHKTIDITIGNMTPNVLRHVILSKAGRPLDTAIALLAEIIYQYSPGKYGSRKFRGDSLNMRYSNLCKDLNKSRDTIRRAFRRLEELGIISCSYRHVELQHTSCYNSMYVSLNIDTLNSICRKANMPERKKQSTRHTISKGRVHLNEGVIYREIKGKAKSLKDKDNFKKNKDMEKTTGKDLKERNPSVDNLYRKRVCYDFLPLCAQMHKDLVEDIGKDYPLSYFEEVIIRFIESDKKKMEGDDAIPLWSYKHLYARLLAWAQREYRSATLIKMHFGIIDKKVDQTQSQQDEKLLSGYESSIDTSPVGSLRRKIAGTLPKEHALVLLKHASIFCSEGHVQISLKEGDMCATMTEASLKESLTPLIMSIDGGKWKLSLKLQKGGLYQSKSETEAEAVYSTLSEDPQIRAIQECVIKDLDVRTYKNWFINAQIALIEREGKVDSINFIFESWKASWVKMNYASRVDDAVYFLHQRNPSLLGKKPRVNIMNLQEHSKFQKEQQKVAYKEKEMISCTNAKTTTVASGA